MATDAQIVECSFRPLFIAVLVSRIPGITVYSVTSDALHEHGHAAELSSLMMTADALGALLALMRKLAIRIQVRFVVPMPEKNYAARSLEIELDDSSTCVVGPDPVAIRLIDRRDRERPRYQSCRHRHDE
jgi:hypothetical protein